MTPETYEATIVILTSLGMCGGAILLWLWSDRSNTAMALIGGIWLVLALAALVGGWPWNIGAMAATVLAVLLLLAANAASDWWRR